MYNFIKYATVVFCMLMANTSVSQTAAEKIEEIPSSILRIGYTPVNQAHRSYLIPGISIDWEKPLSPRFTLGLNLYRDLSRASRFRSDERRIVGDLPTRLQYEYRDIRTSLSVSATYYLKPYAYDGFYASFRLNNLLAETVTYEDATLGLGRGGRNISIKARAGIYLGYRKVFTKGFFIDGAAGVLLNPVKSSPTLNASDYLDFKLSIGWQLNWRKKK